MSVPMSGPGRLRPAAAQRRQVATLATHDMFQDTCGVPPATTRTEPQLPRAGGAD